MLSISTISFILQQPVGLVIMNPSPKWPILCQVGR